MTVSTVQVGQSATITLTLYQDGTQTDLGTVTVGIVDAHGTEVVAPGTAVTDGGTGTYTYSLTKQDLPAFHVNTWSVGSGADFTTYTDIQGSVLFNEAQLRAFDDGAVSASGYTDDEIAKTHQRVVEYMESYTGRSWIRRYCRTTLAGTGSRLLDLGDTSGWNHTSAGLTLWRPGAGQDVIRILSADDGATVTPSDVTIHPGGILQRTDAAWTHYSSDDPRNVTIEYEYGQPYPVDGADRIGMLIARHWLVTSRVSDSASSFNDALGTFTFEPGRLPWEAWSWLNNHKQSGFFA